MVTDRNSREAKAKGGRHARRGRVVPVDDAVARCDSRRVKSVCASHVSRKLSRHRHSMLWPTVFKTEGKRTVHSMQPCKFSLNDCLYMLSMLTSVEKKNLLDVHVLL